MMCSAVNPHPPPADTDPVIKASTKFVSFFGHIANGQRKCHAVAVNGGRIQLELCWTDQETDLDLVLYDPFGCDVDVSIHGKPERIDYDTGGVAGEYTIEVIHFCGSDLVYNLNARYREQPDSNLKEW